MTIGGFPSRRVPAQHLRRLFNEGRYWERARDGEFRMIVKRDQTPTPPPYGHPEGTRSQIVSYLHATGDKIAVVHQYVLPDGTIGGSSGRPDPKYLLHEGIIYQMNDDPTATP
jgi:hypothetical protein